MRLWSLHPQYLDVKGLVAAWREALLAQKVLQGRTRGYKQHPQLDRFRNHPAPLEAIAAFLTHLYVESERRGYQFNREKIGPDVTQRQLPVTDGQLSFEWRHLTQKLKQRDPATWRRFAGICRPLPNSLFYVIKGSVEPWERG